MKNNNIFNEFSIYTKTVLSLKAKINKHNLTPNKYFDLSRIPNLRILDDGFLKLLRNKYLKTQKEMSDFINIPLRTWIGWESYNKFMPFEKLISLSKILKIDKENLYDLIKGSKFNYGSHHGKNNIILPIKPENFNLARYLVPIKPNKTFVVRNTPPEIKEYFLNNFSIDKTYFDKTGLIVIYSYLLNKFLETFYIYKKKPILKFPLSK
ncbi:MAG: helix-turn-helix transcriptional regulator [Candidatus Woesearchaeota archaeon]